MLQVCIGNAGQCRRDPSRAAGYQGTEYRPVCGHLESAHAWRQGAGDYADTPDNLELVGTPTLQNVPGALIEHATYKSNAESLPGQTIEIEGLAAVQTDVLLLIQLQDGTQHSAILRPSAPQFTFRWKHRNSVSPVITGAGNDSYPGRGRSPAVRAGVAAHRDRLQAIAGRGHVVYRGAQYHAGARDPRCRTYAGGPTEAIIALSILFLATEIVHKHNGQFSLTEKYPWVVAFAFGLFHGLGFAGALSEIGVPQHEVPLALFMFNVGVETGQLLFIAVVLSLVAVLKKLPLTAPRGAWRLLPYSIGSVAAFWTIERVASFLPVAS